MKIQMNTICAKLRSTALVAVSISLLAVGSASAMGINGLLGVQPGFPQIDTQGAFPPDALYFSGGPGTLIADSIPVLYFPDPNNVDFFTDGFFFLNAQLDPLGNVLSGSMQVLGNTLGGLTSPILTGDVIAMGLENTNANPGGTDRADFLVNPTGGSMLTDPNWVAGSRIGITMTLEGSTYNGSLLENWQANRVKTIIGPVAGLPEPAMLPLVFLGLTGLWFAARRTAGAKF